MSSTVLAEDTRPAGGPADSGMGQAAESSCQRSRLVPTPPRLRTVVDDPGSCGCDAQVQQHPVPGRAGPGEEGDPDAS